MLASNECGSSAIAIMLGPEVWKVSYNGSPPCSIQTMLMCLIKDQPKAIVGPVTCSDNFPHAKGCNSADRQRSFEVFIKR